MVIFNSYVKLPEGIDVYWLKEAPPNSTAMTSPTPSRAKGRPVAPAAGCRHDPQLPGLSAGSSGWAPRPLPGGATTKR